MDYLNVLVNEDGSLTFVLPCDDGKTLRITTPAHLRADLSERLRYSTLYTQIPIASMEVR